MLEGHCPFNTSCSLLPLILQVGAVHRDYVQVLVTRVVFRGRENNEMRFISSVENASVSSYSRVVVVLAGCTTENNDRLRFFKELFCLESGKYEIASHSFPSLGFYSHPRLRLRERKRSSSLLHIRKFFSCNNDLISKK